jgi:hypothetical protein
VPTAQAGAAGEAGSKPQHPKTVEGAGGVGADILAANALALAALCCAFKPQTASVRHYNLFSCNDAV